MLIRMGLKTKDGKYQRGSSRILYKGEGQENYIQKEKPREKDNRI